MDVRVTIEPCIGTGALYFAVEHQGTQHCSGRRFVLQNFWKWNNRGNEFAVIRNGHLAIYTANPGYQVSRWKGFLWEKLREASLTEIAC